MHCASFTFSEAQIVRNMSNILVSYGFHEGETVLTHYEAELCETHDGKFLTTPTATTFFA
jgi:hypothetical protein